MKIYRNYSGGLGGIQDIVKKLGCPRPANPNYYSHTLGIWAWNQHFRDMLCVGFSARLKKRAVGNYLTLRHFTVEKCSKEATTVICTRLTVKDTLIITEHPVGKCPLCIYKELEND